MKFKEMIYHTIYILVGCALAAFGTSCFLLPNQLSSGGFAGIATIIYYFCHFPMGTTIMLLNIPFFILGYFKLGKNFMGKTVIATILYSVWIDMFEKMNTFTDDRFLASIYGGIAVGMGLAIVFKANASTGGSDLIAHIAQNYNNQMRISNILVILDMIIIGMNLIAFREIEIGLYSAIVIYLSGKMIDLVFEGINFSKMIYIISDRFEEILEKINLESNKGATALYGRGSYTKSDKMIILCVTKRRDIMKVKNIATQIDDHAFIIITDAREVYGLGFKH